MSTDLIQIIRYASKAPSGHNTQPWKFQISNDIITVIPDFEVSLPIVDSDNRELFISLGCAVENLCIAANHFGFEVNILKQNLAGIIVKLTKTLHIVEDNLFYQIEKRQTNRSIYTGSKIPDGNLEQFQILRKENNIQFYFTEIGTPLADTITEYIMKGNEIQMSDFAFKEELLTWMRFNKKQVEVTQSGLSYQVFGNPPLLKVLAKPIVNRFLKPEIQNKSDKKKIDSSSHLVVCTTRYNTIEEWVGLGRMLQRLLLKATEQGIVCAFLNQPCEVAELAKTLREILPVNMEYPTLILRIGYAKPLPYSPRKGMEKLLV